MHVQKSDAIAFGQFSACDIADFSADFGQMSGGNMPRHQRVGNSLQTALLQKNVCAADFRKLHRQQSGAGLKVRL
jgi:hypothetical protein